MVTFTLRKREREIVFVSKRKLHRWFLQNVKAIPGKFQHALVVAERN